MTQVCTWSLYQTKYNGFDKELWKPSCVAWCILVTGLFIFISLSRNENNIKSVDISVIEAFNESFKMKVRYK